MKHASNICVSEEGPANALALNKDFNQVVIAGRNVFKVFSIGENDFTEACNLRVGKNLNLNFSSIDVAWSTIEENTLATAATNGAVVVWNLGRSGRSKQEHVFSDHKRTVNKVSFHLTEPSLLISGSQDGMMKCFDLRMKEVARTFISNTESIRDVQFNPHSSQTFAAVSENGSVQLWDVRRHERCLQQFTAHSGPVFACDWHPDVQWLATASRDKTIKVWDMHAKPNLEHTIYTIASVGHVKWRPQKKHQVASCALVLDCAVHVWDVRRPHLPLATFAEHRDVTTAIAWQSSDTFLSTSRDSSLYRLSWSSAAHPVLWANPHGVFMSARHELAHAAPAAPLPPLAHSRVDPRPTTLGRKQPTAGSLTPAAQAALERLFPGGAGSILSRYSAPVSPFVACAIGYKIRGAPPHELAEHNAKVARDNERHMTAHLWEVVGAVCAAPPAPPPARPPPPPNPAPAQPQHHSNNAVEEEPMEEVEEWTENQFYNSGVLGLPTHSIYIPPTKFAKQLNNDDTTAWISAASAHYVDVEAADWSLPEEAFPLRTAPPDSVANRLSDEKDAANQHCPSANASSSSPGGTSSSGSGSRSGSTGSHNNVLTHSIIYHSYSQQSSVTVEESETNDNSLSVRVPLSARPQLDMAPLLDTALRHHAALGDVQTPAVVLLVLHNHRNELFPYIEEGLQEQWLLGYIELLQRHKLYNQAAEVVRCSWISSVWQMSQQSTSVALSCGRCGKRTKTRSACECTNKPDLCAVCHQVVRGLFAWCQGCAHGGHLRHVQQWMSQHQLCPAGCGHHCQLG